MRAIINGKLYDTQNSTRITVFFIPSGECRTKTFDVYRTKKGNMFAVCRSEDVALDADQIREMFDGNPKCADSYIKIFGMPEEA